MTTRVETEPCGAYCARPVAAPTNKQPDRTIVVRCNRPSGHEGEHMFSTVKAARLVEWPR